MFVNLHLVVIAGCGVRLGVEARDRVCAALHSA